MTDAGLGEWEGVTVDMEGRLTKLELGYNNLAARPSTERAEAAVGSLKVLWLHGNKLTGSIPAELGG